MNTLIKQLENKALSDTDILNLIDHKANLVTYSQLTKVNNIDQIFGKYNACVILYLTKKNYGHWCCIIKRGNVIEFFDPYGLKPDEALNFDINPYFREVSNQIFPHLTYLLFKSHKIIEYNDYQFQKFKKDIKTCGRHVAVRLLFKNMPLEIYKKFILSSRFDPDKTVTLLTAHI